MRAHNIMAVLMFPLLMAGAAVAEDSDPLVVMRKVVGVDEAGRSHVLFQDGGWVTRLSDLPDVMSRLNARDVINKGMYRNVTVELDDAAYATGIDGHVQSRPLESRLVRFDGWLKVTKYRVIPQGLVIQGGDEHFSG